MLTHCCDGYLKLIEVQNVHHQPQCIVDNDVQQYGTLLSLLLAEKQRREFRFRASALAVFLVFWRTQCSLNHLTGKRLTVLSQEIGVDTPTLPLRPTHLLGKRASRKFLTWI